MAEGKTSNGHKVTVQQNADKTGYIISVHNTYGVTTLNLGENSTVRLKPAKPDKDPFCPINVDSPIEKGMAGRIRAAAQPLIDRAIQSSEADRLADFANQVSCPMGPGSKPSKSISREGKQPG